MTEKLQTGTESPKGDGKITFANDVISTIAGLAASEVKGLAGMSGGVVEGFAEKLGRRNLTKGVKVELGTEEVAVTLNIIVKYGVNIQEVALDVQKSVKTAVETMTGLRVVEVNVSVLGIETEKEKEIVVKEPVPEPQPKLR